MIQFFRRIRQKLLTEGKLSKYLVYAIGEIALVMVGILLALQVNNWNEERKAIIEEKEILEQLRIDFTRNQESLVKWVDTHRNMYNRVISVSSLISPEPKPITHNELDSLMVAVYYNPEYKPVNNTLSTISSSGKLAIIRDHTLKELISSWTNAMDDYKNNVNYTFNHYFSYTSPFLNKNYQMRNLRIDDGLGHAGPSKLAESNSAILSNKEFENYVELKRLNSAQSVIHSEKVFAIQQNIIERIDKVLNEN